jgi:hypothetical protein
VRADARAGRMGRFVSRFTLLDEGRDNAVVASGAAVFRAVDCSRSDR